jgi:hypothetical protein
MVSRARGNAAISVNSVFLAEAPSILPDHTHFLPTETSVLDRHAEQQVLILLVVGSKSVLVEQHQFSVIRARFSEVGKILSNRSDQAGLSLHPFVVGHRAKRIADPEQVRIPQMEMARRLTSPPFC